MYYASDFHLSSQSSVDCCLLYGPCCRNLSSAIHVNDVNFNYINGKQHQVWRTLADNQVCTVR